MQTHQFSAMNTSIVLQAEGTKAQDAFKRAEAYIKKEEQRFSRFLPDSELSALNRSAGEWVGASLEMMDLLDNAVETHLATQGLFDPAVLPELRAIGYTRSLGGASRPLGSDPAEIHERRGSASFAKIELDWVKRRVRIPSDMQIDLGGIAKGWIAEQTTRLMTSFSPASAVSIGGDIFLLGAPHGKGAWEVGLEDPRDPTQDLILLLVEDGAVATSSTVKRTWTQGTEERHHLIDPRSGEPAWSPWLSVTVFAPRAVLAEAFAKAILIGGPFLAESLLEKHPEISFIAVDAEGLLWTSPTKKEEIYA